MNCLSASADSNIVRDIVFADHNCLLMCITFVYAVNFYVSLCIMICSFSGWCAGCSTYFDLRHKLSPLERWLKTRGEKDKEKKRKKKKATVANPMWRWSHVREADPVGTYFIVKRWYCNFLVCLERVRSTVGTLNAIDI